MRQMPQIPQPQWHSGPPWWGFLGWLLPVLVIALLVVVAVLIVTRTTRHEHPSAQPAPDLALDQVRLRYANGEIGREEFEQLSADLGGPGA
jgi:uncharacterized membrane protein